MRFRSRGVLALTLMLWLIGLGHAFALGSQRASASPVESSAQWPEASQRSPIPEPSTLLVFASGLAGLAIFGTQARPRTQ